MPGAGNSAGVRQFFLGQRVARVVFHLARFRAGIRDERGAGVFEIDPGESRVVREDVRVLHDAAEVLGTGSDGRERDVIRGVRVARPADAAPA